MYVYVSGWAPSGAPHTGWQSAPPGPAQTSEPCLGRRARSRTPPDREGRRLQSRSPASCNPNPPRGSNGTSVLRPRTLGSVSFLPDPVPTYPYTETPPPTHTCWGPSPWLPGPRTHHTHCTHRVYPQLSPARGYSASR